jgi:hypothetical protein
MSLTTLVPVAGIAWMAAGLLMGAGGMVARQRLRAWRQARNEEWDPY